MHAKRVDIDLGVIEADGDRVVGYREKPQLDYDVSMGIYAYDERALQYLPDAGLCQFPDFVRLLLDAGEYVAGFRSEVEWFDIGTPAEHQRAVDAFEANPGAFAP
jgi:mannose-1-phosphate guanylyltransferase